MLAARPGRCEAGARGRRTRWSGHAQGGRDGAPLGV